jgi:hypothetical protein
MVVPAMTQGNTGSRKHDSLIGKIVWWNMLQIRQRLIDEYWWNKLRESDLASGKSRPTLRSMNAAQRVKFIHDVTPLVRDDLGQMSYFPEEDDLLPPSKLTKEQFAADTGIDDARFNELQARHQIPNVEELVNIARIGDVDIAFMFIPPKDMQESDRTLLLDPINGITHEIPTHRWVLWVRGYMQLPGQHGNKYLVETASPSIKKVTLSGNAKRTYAEIEREMEARTKSSVSAIETVKDEITNTVNVLNLDINKIDPFDTGKSSPGYAAERGVKLSSSAHQIAGHIRKLVSLSSNKSSDRSRLRNRFTVAVSGIHQSLVMIIKGNRLIN